MYFGSVLNERLQMFGFTPDSFSNDVLMDQEYIKKIIKDEISFEEIVDFDIQVISNALFCEPEYFVDESARKKDVVFNSSNRGNNSAKSNLAKAKLQLYMKDFRFVEQCAE